MLTWCRIMYLFSQLDHPVKKKQWRSRCKAGCLSSYIRVYSTLKLKLKLERNTHE